MTTIYKRKCSSGGKWTEDQLKAAIRECRANGLTLGEVSRVYGIPPRTLKRRRDTNNTKRGKMGPESVLGSEGEHKIVRHVIKLQKHGFTPSRHDVREMAFKLAERLKLSHKFDKAKGLTGYDCLNSFLRRNPQLSIRKAEGLSRHGSEGMNRETVAQYFELLRSMLEENELFDEPANIYNMDETGIQLNNKPGHVIAERGSKSVTKITAAEKGETITVVSCCNAEGIFLPPVCVFKDKNLKKEFTDGMPPGPQVYMSQKSEYINSDFFLKWLKEHFYPRKCHGKTLLILDGHASHCNKLETLKFAEDHDIILLCLPPHTTHCLQPLDRAVFLKSAFNAIWNNWIKSQSDRKISRLQFGTLLNQAWGKAASVQNGVSGFSATGMYPDNPMAIPDYAYTAVVPADENGNVNPVQANSQNQEENQYQITLEDLPTRPAVERNIPRDMSSQNRPRTPDELTVNIEKITPGKILDEELPVPKTIIILKTRGRKVAEISASPENIAKRKRNVDAKLEKQNQQQQLSFPGPFGCQTKSKRNTTISRNKEKSCKKLTLRKPSTSSDTSGDISLDDSTYVDVVDDLSRYLLRGLWRRISGNEEVRRLDTVYPLQSMDA